VPITEWKDAFHGAVWMVRVDPDKENNLKKISAIDTFQIRSVSTKKFLKKIGSLSPALLQEIKIAIKAVIDTD
jgi:mRNA interferase MazF